MLNIVASIAASAGASVVGVVAAPVVGAIGAVAGTVLAGKYIYDKLSDQGGNAAPPVDEHRRSASTITAHDPELLQRALYAEAVWHAGDSMRLLLQQHVQVVHGDVKEDLNIDDLRSVGMSNESEPLRRLKPLTKALSYCGDHLARAHALQHGQEQLNQAHAFLAQIENAQP